MLTSMDSPKSTAGGAPVLPVPAFRDNYIWLIRLGTTAIVVDPGDAGPVEAALSGSRLRLAGIVLTHHHHDHVGGVPALVARRPDVPVYGPRKSTIGQVTSKVGEGDTIAFRNSDGRAWASSLDLSVIEIPGHTLDHIACFGSIDGHPALFCGDTLFAAGCGRLFEGTAEEMHRSLSRLAALPPETLIYCGHEYTVANLEFAVAVEPDNSAIRTRLQHARALRAEGRVTLPSTIGLERETNPFLRCETSAVRAAAEKVQPGASGSAVATFAAIRAWKDRFTGPDAAKTR